MIDQPITTLGINTIDAQHCEIFGMLNRLRSHVYDAGILLSALDNLIGVMRDHFMFESNYIHVADPSPTAIRRHYGAHAHIIDRVISIRHYASEHWCVDSDDVDHLIELIRAHVEQEDVIFATWYSGQQKTMHDRAIAGN